MADIFVSYARTDKARVAPLVAALEAQGWSVWWDPGIVPGQEFDQLIAEELDRARAVICVWTPASVGSRWVRGEAREAADRGVLVPVRFEGARLPIDVRAIHTTDLDQWKDDAKSAPFQELVGALSLLLKAPSRGGGAQAQTEKRPSVAICVLPFANMSGDPEQEYFSDGITEDIITDLSKVSAISIIARNSAFAFKGKQVDVLEVARQLKVTHVLEGSVRKSGNRVRITAQLIDGATNNHVWAERYDRDLVDIFALQDEISEAIVSALKLKLLPEEKKAIETRGTENVEAYNLYLLARQTYATGLEADPRRNETIIRVCKRATEIDPNYARAWALMALAQMILRSNHGGGGDGGLAAAERALALDAGLAEAHAVKARILTEDGRPDEAAAEIAEALSLDPESYEVNKAAAFLCFGRREFEESIRYWQKAVTLMELDFASTGLLVTCYTALGNQDAARAAAEATLKRCEKVLAQDSNNGAAMGHGSIALAVLGRADRAKEWMNRALLFDPDNIDMRYNFACAFAMSLKDVDAALDMLEPILPRVAGAFINYAKVDPDLDPLRGHPRFKAMIAAAEARLGIAKTAS